MTVYELNQAGYASLPTYTDDDLSRAYHIVYKLLQSSGNTYFMMLNHDVHYFTLYVDKRKGYGAMSKEILDVMSELGEIKSIELSSDSSSIEFWLVDSTGNCNMYLLFPYDRGVIEV